jgi:hypothetical protein
MIKEGTFHSLFRFFNKNIDAIENVNTGEIETENLAR